MIQPGTAIRNQDSRRLMTDGIPRTVPGFQLLGISAVRTIRILFAFAAVVWSQIAFGQLVLQDQYAQHAPIVIRCEVPSVPLTTITLLWSVDEAAYSLPCPTKNGVDELHVWAPPGEHWAEATVISNRYREQVIRIPDQDEPANPAKFKVDTVRINVSTDVQRYKKKFSVSGVPPSTPITPTTPKPLPPNTPPKSPPQTPPPNPTPPTDDELKGLYNIAPKIRDRIALMQDITLEEIIGIAKNYRDAATEIASGQATVDDMMGNASKRIKGRLGKMHAEVLATPKQLAAWSTFWPWLDNEYAKLKRVGKLSDDPIKVVALLSEVFSGLAAGGEAR